MDNENISFIISKKQVDMFNKYIYNRKYSIDTKEREM